MERRLRQLAGHTFDLAVVGGGIVGAFVALDAVCRGLDVALVEKDDFGSGTTSGSGKVLHGGIRYLQTAQISLARQARREQARLARMAGPLVRPLPFLVPGRQGRRREDVLLRGGALAWEGFRRLTEGEEHLPGARYVASARSFLPSDRLADAFGGGLVFHDLQLRSPERFTFEVVRAAWEQGAAVANHCEVRALTVSGGRVRGMEVRDRLGGDDFTVSASRVVNAAGAWAPGLAADAAAGFPDVAFGKGVHVVLDRPEPPAALALPYRGRGRRPDGPDTERNVFLVPWEGRTLVGASYEPCRRPPDRVTASAADVRSFLTALGEQWPGLELEGAPVLYAYAGLYPAFGRARPPEDGYAASDRPLVVDHGRTGGPDGLVTVVGVKFTTARSLAEDVTTTLLGDSPRTGPTAGMDGLVTAENLPEGLGDPGALPELAARGARSEMARNLTDVVFRRSWVGHLGPPGDGTLREAARAMGSALGWSREEAERRAAAVSNAYRPWDADETPGAGREG